MKKIIVFSIIISLPINIFGFIWYFKTIETYTELEKYRLTFDKGKKLEKIGNAVFYDMKYAAFKALGKGVKTNASLVLKDSAINSLNANLPLSGSDYKDDSLFILDGKIIRGKAKLRGDHYYHWSMPRKSWRFKTTKKQIHEGINKFNLIIPKSVDMQLNHMSYSLAKMMGLLAPMSRLVEFSLNGQYKGTRLLVEQIDESFLRKNRRMPNDIYRGDNIGQSAYIGVKVLLFSNPSIWEKVSYNNHYASDNLLPLEVMVKEISENKFTIYDIKNFATMAAYTDITGSYHHDRTHNWILYYDSYYEKMFPIIWDTIGWVAYSVKLDNMNIATSELMQSLYLNYDFLREKYKALNHFFNDQEQLFIKTLTDAIAQSENIIKKNNYAFTLARDLLSEEEALASINQFQANIIDRLARVENYFLGPVNSNDYHYSLDKEKLRLSISGSKLLSGINIRLKNTEEYEKTLLSYKQNSQIVSVDISENTTLTNEYIHINLDLFANTREVNSYKGTTKIAFHEATYDFEFIGINNQDIESVSVSFDNNDQQNLTINMVADIEQKNFNSRLKNIVTKSKLTDTVTWQGQKHLSGFNLVEENIIIEKGTKLIFDEGASLKVLGKVTALGTADEPIVFEAQDSSKPWGAFALKDEAANGSIFKHVIFKDGSGDKGDLYEYTAMLSIHNVQNVLIEDSAFYDSKLTDDMVHVIYSDIKFKNTTFVRSLSDALDIDISTAIIENCEFINSGNDSIDLMTSNAVVINTTFSHSKDKGISIGEGSNLLAINNLIENSEMGMQSKDTSKAYIYNTTFIGNKKAIDAYHKNWRYSEGGTIYVDNCIMNKNLENATVGKKSKVIINNCDIDTIDNFNDKNLRKGKITVSEKQTIKADFELPFFHKYDELIRNNIKGSYE